MSTQQRISILKYNRVEKVLQPMKNTIACNADFPLQAKKGAITLKKKQPPPPPPPTHRE